MSKSIRLTYAAAMVLQALDRGYRYGFDIVEATGVRSGTVYPLLRRLEEAKMVRSKWEPVTIARASHRPPRKYYEVTDAAHDLLAAAHARFPALSNLPAGSRALDEAVGR
jgi:DNA-binding PadR family transcriptional regulator